MGQGFIFAARLKAVEIPSASAISITSATAGSIVFSLVIIKLLHSESYKLETKIQLPISNFQY